VSPGWQRVLRGPLARWYVAAVGTVGAVVAAVVAPAEQDLRHYDHIGFENTIRLVKGGTGVYEAFQRGMADIGSVMTQARSFRQLGIFLLWAAIPSAALQPTFFLVVCLGSVLLAMPMQRYPWVALAIGAWLAKAGVFDGVDAWLLSELWAVPLILGCVLAWHRGHDNVAALCALGAMLIRETIVLLPIGMFFAARAKGRPVRPWLAAIAAAGVALAIHWWMASDHLAEEGHEAALWGTGTFDSVAMMTSFLVVPQVVGLVIWVVGLVKLWQSSLRGAVGLAAMPLTGLLVARPYWGFVAMPLALLALGGLPPWEDARSASDAGPAGRATAREPGRDGLEGSERGATSA
jgi:hypothetical protein